MKLQNTTLAFERLLRLLHANLHETLDDYASHVLPLNEVQAVHCALTTLVRNGLHLDMLVLDQDEIVYHNQLEVNAPQIVNVEWDYKIVDHVRAVASSVSVTLEEREFGQSLTGCADLNPFYDAENDRFVFKDVEISALAPLGLIMVPIAEVLFDKLLGADGLTLAHINNMELPTSVSRDIAIRINGTPYRTFKAHSMPVVDETTDTMDLLLLTVMMIHQDHPDLAACNLVYDEESGHLTYEQD